MRCREPTSQVYWALVRSLAPTRQGSAVGLWLSPRMGCFRHLEKLGQKGPPLKAGGSYQKGARYRERYFDVSRST